jgi:hypothetical protein
VSDKRKRRWYQFSLRTLLVTTTVASVAMAWLAHERKEVRKREAAIAAITKLGGRIEFDRSQPFRPLWLRPLLGDRSAGEVVTVVLDGDQVTDSGLIHLAGLTKLRRVKLDRTKVTGAGLVHLAARTKLEGLSLNKTTIDDGHLAHLTGLTELRNLDLDRTYVSAGLVYVARLPKLSCLNLEYSQVTDFQLARLSGLTELKKLNLAYTSITDAGLVHLTGLTKLEELDLRGTNVTDEGADQLQEALPKARIIRWHANIRSSRTAK